MEEISPTPDPSSDPTTSEKIATRPPTRLIWLVLLVVAFALGMGTGYLLLARPQEARAAAAEQKLAALEKTSATSEASAAQNQVEVPQQVKRYDVPVADSPALGNANAPITLIEFSDYECPYCRQWHQEVWPKIQSQYGNKVRLVYRDFPLSSIHPDAIPAAEAAECAGAQNQYFKYNDLLFGGSKPLGHDTYVAYAQQIGLNMAEFNKCVDGRLFQKKVEDNVNFATNLGVRSTPTFFINGLAIVGAQPFEVFQQVIDLELAGKIPK